MKINIFIITTKDKDLLITSQGLKYLSPNYTLRETIAFWYSKGVKINTQRKRALKMLNNFNDKIQKINNNNYEEWLEYLEEKQEDGYDTRADFFDNIEYYGELKTKTIKIKREVK